MGATLGGQMDNQWGKQKPLSATTMIGSDGTQTTAEPTSTVATNVQDSPATSTAVAKNCNCTQENKTWSMVYKVAAASVLLAAAFYVFKQSKTGA